MLKKLIWMFVVITLLVAGALFWGKAQFDNYLSSPTLNVEQALMTVKPRTSFNQLLSQLEQQKVISSPKLDQVTQWLHPNLTQVLIRYIHPELTQFKAGTFAIETGGSVQQALNTLVKGQEYQFTMTLVEGETFKQWRQYFKGVDSIEHKTDTMSEADIAQYLGSSHKKLEGLLLPETYHYTMGTSDLEILKRAYQQMDRLLQQQWEKRKNTARVKTPYQALILGSIIEKETGISGERGLVSSVFNNRLKKGMRLQTDPTVIYGMGERYNGNITRKDLRTRTAYNTYVINGLPPTPIAMMSRASLIAALNPEKSNYYYFVADGTGGHKFSTTLRQHNQAVRAYLKTLKKK
ncbi:endolytic transglycosylase MltG [Vibrio sp. SS-MA-C1-2]|uniref:endolytic transglycosylase MltG n=1 Tax=Vibrio sp. SS-MA-C1-2 TaxID=2908646 RepID=UPI001F15836D|nr:endolytic transglycosylase MltG [Vibrio sp. SS-MA-C1-2]UJF19921.1 endolytic transglycosylase MltG [Vibrio sp. SS-MA-C1-2]